MRTTIAIIMIIAGIAIIIFVCITQKSNTIEVNVLLDITDNQLAKPNPDEIISLYNFDDKYNGGIFKLAQLTDVSFNPSTEAKIATKNEWLSNEMERDKEIKIFKNQISKLV